MSRQGGPKKFSISLLAYCVAKAEFLDGADCMRPGLLGKSPMSRQSGEDVDAVSHHRLPKYPLDQTTLNGYSTCLRNGSTSMKHRK